MMNSRAAVCHLFGLMCYAASTCLAQTDHERPKPKVTTPLEVTGISRISPDLACLRLNNPADLTGYAHYKNVAFDPQIAVNPKNPHNMVIVTQQDTLANANYNSALPLSCAIIYTLDGGTTWNQAGVVLSRCQGATNYQAHNNFSAAYFPSVTFDSEGICYVLITGYNIFSADHQQTVSLDEGNIIAKSIDGGVSWDEVGPIFRDDGSCHFIDYPHIAADPHRKRTEYIVYSDNTCFVFGNCADPDYTGNQNIIFQKSTDEGFTWSPQTIIASYIPTDPDQCTPIPVFNQIDVLPDKKRTLIVSTILQEHAPDDLATTPADHLHIYRSEDEGATWQEHIVDSTISHVLAVDADSFDPILPVTPFTTKDMAVNQKNGYIYLVYSDPRFNSTGRAGAVIRKSVDGGISWSEPRPVNPKSVDVQTFLPHVAVAKDGTVGVLFYDLRNFTPGDQELHTDVWMTFFDEELHHYYGEVRLTQYSFDTRQSIRGFNGVDQQNCYFDYYLSNHVGLEAIENDFVATFTITHENCNVATIGTFPCNSFPLSMETCNRQNVVFVNIHKTKW